MARAFIAVGSSIEAEENLRESIRLLSERSPLVGISTVYRTEAIGRPGAPPFLNCVVEMETDLPPDRLEREVLKRIEGERGRLRGPDPWGPRTCDLDLVLYLRRGQNFTPRPDDLERPFVAAALAELDPSLVLPGHSRALGDEIRRLRSDGMEPLDALTASVRKRFLNGTQYSAH